MRRSPAMWAVGALVTVGLMVPATAAAHYSLPGGEECEAIELAPQSDFDAFGIEVKRITCRNARPVIKAIARGGSSGSFDCKRRATDGDSESGIAHSDYKCRKDRKRIVFGVS